MSPTLEYCRECVDEGRDTTFGRPDCDFYINVTLQQLHCPIQAAVTHAHTFLLLRMGFSCSWEQLLFVGSATEVKQKFLKQKPSCRTPTH